MKLLMALVLFTGFLSTLLGASGKLEDTLILPDSPPVPGRSFAVVLTGDGGWAELIREVAAGLTRTNIPCVGWNSRAYYGTARTPEGAAADLARLMERFEKEWNRPHVTLVGYSRGADVLPFLFNRLPEAQRSRVEQIVLLAPAHWIEFEFHLSDYWSSPGRTPKSKPVVKEIQQIKGVPLLVLYGDEDGDSCGHELQLQHGQVVELRGDHHFHSDYGRILAATFQHRLEQLKPSPPPEATPR
jgi:type IV secretory pathway VirJ component